VRIGAGLDAVEKRKTFPCWESNLSRPAGSPSLYRLSYHDSYKSKIVDKKDILRTLFNTGIYCSGDKVGTVYLV
jgi:hypothetical protein